MTLQSVYASKPQRLRQLAEDTAGKKLRSGPRSLRVSREARDDSEGEETDNWKLVTGHWKLVTGHWKLATGHWQPATGNWTLDTGN